MDENLKCTFTVFITYEDESGFQFEVTLEGKEHEIVGELCMITRGTLMAANAEHAEAYDNEGFDVCAYRQ